MSPISLSLIIPKYNHRDLAIKNMAILNEFLIGCNVGYEIILVDDGSKDNERVYDSDLPTPVKLIQLEQNMGKGFAVKQGMLKASGDCVIFTDLDLPYHLSVIPYAYDLIVNKDFDFVAGDRTLHHSRYYCQIPFFRKLSSLFFSKIVTLFVIGGIFDSQCGFKGFSRRLAKNLFPLITINRFSFDVEVYYILLKYNILIKRIPVFLCSQDSKTVNPFSQSFEMIKEILAIPLKWRFGKYESEAMKEFGAEVYWTQS